MWQSSRVELTHWENEIHKEERDVLEGEMRKIDECGMEKFGTLDSSEKTKKRSLAEEIDGDHRRRYRKGIRNAMFSM